MQLWQKKGSLRKRESCRQEKTFFLHQFNHSNKASVGKKKKRNFFEWQKTLHLTKPLLFDGKTLHLTKSFFSEFGGVLLWFLLLHQNNCFETKGFLSPICNQQMTNFGKGKNIWGRKKIDTFRSPTRELILDACYFVDKTRKAAGQWNNRTFSFSSRLHSILSSFHFFLSR